MLWRETARDRAPAFPTIASLVRCVVGVSSVIAVLGLTAPAGTATQKPHSPTVGSTISTRDVAVTLRAYRARVTLKASAATNPAGRAVTAIDVKICNTAGRSLSVRRGQFFLEAQDRHLFLPAAASSAPEPQLETTRLARGHCLRGWVSYLVPSSTRAAFAVFQAGAMFTPTLHTWTLPAVTVTATRDASPSGERISWMGVPS